MQRAWLDGLAEALRREFEAELMRALGVFAAEAADGPVGAWVVS